MAFGRDGTELELAIFDLQNKKLVRALEEIVERCGDEDAVRIARDALAEADQIRNKFVEE